MSRFSETLRRIRFERHMTQDEFAELLGTTKQNISRYESGAVSPKISTAQEIADKLGIGLSELNGQTTPQSEPALPRNVTPITQLHRQRIPLIGKVAAGEPIYAPEDYAAYVDSPVKCDAAVGVQGDSMIPKFEDGDTVYVRCQPDVEDGRVAVVFLDDEAVIKRVYHEKEGLTLLSDNPAYGPIRATFDEYNVIRIFGIPVGLTRMFKPDLSNKIRKGFK